MSRTNEKKRITVDDILRLTNNGLDIWQKEVPYMTLKCNILSPIRNENRPSFKIKQSSTSGIYIGKDYTSGEIYTPITLVQKIYHLNFSEALNKIASDFNLQPKIKEYSKFIETNYKAKLQEPEDLLYEFEEMRFQKTHHEYWNKGELTEDFLRNNNIYAASKFSINKKIIEIPDNQMCFVYIPKDLPYGKLKILRIGVPIEDKWRTNISNFYLWDYSNYTKKVEKLIVCKSRKDEMIMKLLGYNTISVQSENWQILDINMEKIYNICDKPIILFGSDKDGVNKCKIVQQKYNCNYYNTPKSLLPDINDPFSMVSIKGLRQLERHLKSKNI